MNKNYVSFNHLSHIGQHLFLELFEHFNNFFEVFNVVNLFVTNFSIIHIINMNCYFVE